MTDVQRAVPVAQEVVNLCRVMAKADGLDWDEVCPYENDSAENLGDVACDSGTCVATHYEDHDVEVARERYIALSKAVLASLPHKPGEGPGEVAFPNIGLDPMKGNRADRIEQSVAACREAYVKQQKGIPDQTALVWRWHLGALLECATRLKAILSRPDATQTREAILGHAVANILPIGDDRAPCDRVIPIYVRMDELRALRELAALSAGGVA